MDLQTEYIRRYFIENWKCHTHRWIYRRISFIDISQKVVEIPHLPTTLQMERVCRHFTESWKILTGYATITDRINSSVYFHQEFFFHVFSVCKTNNNIFFIDKVSNGMWYYRRKGCRLILSVGDLVGKKFIDRIWILH
jgi:hypothetical protein